MAVKEILHLGHPALRVACTPIRNVRTDALRSLIDDLRDTLHDFRQRYGFGRGIAAPQIGGSERVLLIDMGSPLALLNPVIVRRSRKRITLWDDCFSFPDLTVKVRRNLSVEVRYQDAEGKRHLLKAEGSVSELLQHEIDHLDGVLAIDRAIDTRHIIYKSELHHWTTAATVTM